MIQKKHSTERRSQRLSTRGKTAAIKTALAFYGGKFCCITGDLPILPQEVDWHHLDEKRVDKKAGKELWRFENIIPIRRGLNSAIDLHKRNPVYDLPRDVTPLVLQARARELFDCAGYAQGYACSRLSAFLTDPRREVLWQHDKWTGRPTATLSACVWALLALRPISGSSSAMALATDTLKRSVIPMLAIEGYRRKSSYEVQARLAIEIAAYYREFGRVADSVRFCTLAKNLMHGIQISDETKARVHQQRGLCLIGTESKESESEFDCALDLIPGDNPRVKSTTGFWKIRAQPIEQRLRELEDAIAELEGAFGKIENVLDLPAGRPLPGYTHGTVAEITIATADHESLTGKDSTASSEHAYNFLTKTGFQPSLVTKSTSVREFEEAHLPSTQWTVQRDATQLQAFAKTPRESAIYSGTFKAASGTQSSRFRAD